MEEINGDFGKFLDDISCNTINNYRIALMKLVMELFFDETVKSRDRMGAYSKRVLSAPNRETIQNIFSEMFGELIPSYKRFEDGHTAAKQPSKSDTIIETIKMVVNNQYYCTSLSVASMAEEMKMSSGYLGKLFKASEGMTVSDYIHMVRINNAAKILSGSNSSIKDVMELVGYDNESTFYSKFKKYMGMIPKEFRTMNSDTSGMIY